MPCITYHCGSEHKRRVLIVGGQFSGNFTARDLKRAFHVTVVDAKEFFEYTPGILRAFVKPAHFDALTFTLQPVYERKMGVKFVWGEVKKLNERDALVKPIYLANDVTINFDYCVVCAGCNFGPFRPNGESLWFPVVHEEARKISEWKHIDERFIEGRRRHVLEEFHAIAELEKNNATVLIVGAGFIGVEWVTELEHFFPALECTIIDMLPNCLGPLPAIAANYCSEYMNAVGVKEFYGVKFAPTGEFYESIKLPKEGPTKQYVCIGVKASNFFMPKETLSDKGPGGGGWIHFNEALQVTEKPEAGSGIGKVWANGRIFAVGDCNYGCIPKDVKKPPAQEYNRADWILPPIPKISYPGEEQAIHAIWNLERLDSHLYGNHGCGKLLPRKNTFRKTWFPWGAGMFATSLGPHDACFVMGANPKKQSGYMVNWWIPAALQKEIIESSKIDECKDHVVGKLIWHFVHHTPFHLWGEGMKLNYCAKFTPMEGCK